MSLSEYRYLLAFGSNLGDRSYNLHESLRLLKNEGISILRQSLWIETQPLPHTDYDIADHAPYINFVCEVQCHQAPLALYEGVIVRIENRIGHSRAAKWQPRQLDIDILFAAKNTAETFEKCLPVVYDSQTLKIPHQGYKDRSFLIELVNSLGIFV